MRTTIDLPDALLRQARRRAGAAGTTLSGVVSEALRAFLTSAREPEARYKVVTFGSPGARFPTETEMREALDADDAEGLRVSPRKT